MFTVSYKHTRTMSRCLTSDKNNVLVYTNSIIYLAHFLVSKLYSSLKVWYKTITLLKYWTDFRDRIKHFGKISLTQQTFTRSKSTKEILDVIDVLLVSLLLALDTFHIFFWCFYRYFWACTFYWGCALTNFIKLPE